MRAVRRRLDELNLGAEPGPSGQRNSLLQKVARVRGGTLALQKWCGVWNSGKMGRYSTELWTAGISVPIDCGPRPGTPTGRKIRPITLCESLVKFAEAVGLDECNEK
eukprot:9063582-Karenia_brevis.AAC.1